MNPPTRVLVAHPERQHSHQLAAGLHAACMLAHYYHGAGLTAEVASLLPSSMRTQVRWFQPMRRLLPFTVPKRHQDHVFLAMLKRFDTFIARKLEASPCAAVIAYERSALETFTAAKRVGAACILDAASLHHLSLIHI